MKLYCVVAVLLLPLLSCSRHPSRAASGGGDNPPASIGSATMKPDGTIVLRLRAAQPNMVGEALLEYHPGDPRYSETLKHLGGLRPGETKSVPPWPD